MLSVPYSAMITPSDVPSYSNSESDALCLVLDTPRCSAVNVKSYEPYSPPGRNALCVVRDAHRCSAVVFESYEPYSSSGRNALCVVQDAHRYSAVVFESYVPYCPSGRNYYYYFFSFISLIADGLHHSILPVVTKDLPISPRFTPYTFFIAMQVKHSYNSSTNG